MEISAIVPIVLASVVALNLVLKGLYEGLEVIKNKTASNVDDKIASALSKVLAVSQKIVEFLGAMGTKK